MGKVTTSQLLMKQAPSNPVNSRFPIEEYYDRAERLMRQAMIYRAGQDQFNLFVIQARFSSLLLDTIPKHQSFKQVARNRERYKELNKPLIRAISELEKLKQLLDNTKENDLPAEKQQQAPREPAPASVSDLPFDDLSIASKDGDGVHSEGPCSSAPNGGGPIDLLSGTEADLIAAATQSKGGYSGGSHSDRSFSGSSTSGNSLVSYPSMEAKPIAAPLVPEVRNASLQAASAPAMPPPPPPPAAQALPPSNGVTGGMGMQQHPGAVPQMQQAHQMPPPPPPSAAREYLGLPPSDDEPQMTAHRPKVVENMPTKNEADMDYMNLADRLKHYGLKEKKVKGDGNCQFRSLSDQLFGSTDRHAEVRRMAINQLRSHSDLYEPYVPEEYEKYVGTMAKDGEWGDHVTLQAAADVYGRRICVLSSYKTNFIIDIKPQKTLHQRVLWLSFWAEVHYNSLYPSSSL